MKRPAEWDHTSAVSSSDEDSSGSDSDGGANKKATNRFELTSNLKDVKPGGPHAKKGGLSYDALSRHGYKGGPSVLKVPLPVKEPNWSWSTGKDAPAREDPPQESYAERERTRAIASGETLLKVRQEQPPSKKDNKLMSFSQKEKRKRDLGQASRGKSYVEEEKRLLRDSGIYSGFDS